MFRLTVDFFLLTIHYNTVLLCKYLYARNYWVFRLCPLSAILTKLNNTTFRKLDLLPLTDVIFHVLFLQVTVHTLFRLFVIYSPC